MCYSAQIEHDLNKYVRIVGPHAAMNLQDFIKKYWWRQQDFHMMKIPKAVDAWFTPDGNGDQAKIADMVETFNDKEAAKFEQELFKQKKRLADAERSLQKKETKKALNDQRVATDKIEWAPGQAQRHQTHGAEEPRRVYLPWLLGAGDRRGKRQAHNQADALSVPACR
jgi:hypothetical protein